LRLKYIVDLSDHSFIPTLNIHESIEREILESKLDLCIKKFLHLRILNLRTRTRPHSVQTLMNSFLYLDYEGSGKKTTERAHSSASVKGDRSGVTGSADESNWASRTWGPSAKVSVASYCAFIRATNRN